MTYQHHVFFKLDLKDGQSYALDLIGAQFGRERTIMPWKEYKAGFIHNDVVAHDMGWAAQGLHDYIAEHSAEAMATALTAGPTLIENEPHKTVLQCIIQKGLTDELEKALKGWSKRAVGGIGKIVRGNSGAFDKDVEEFQREIEAGVEWYVKELWSTD